MPCSGIISAPAAVSLTPFRMALLAVCCPFLDVKRITLYSLQTARSERARYRSGDVHSTSPSASCTPSRPQARANMYVLLIHSSATTARGCCRTRSTRRINGADLLQFAYLGLFGTARLGRGQVEPSIEDAKGRRTNTFPQNVSACKETHGAKMPVLFGVQLHALRLSTRSTPLLSATTVPTPSVSLCRKYTTEGEGTQPCPSSNSCAAAERCE
ncbi:hypothetical protein BV20DRAFT_53612 [Pilatotrama ljubarskyi]|nr:hypothetical protein BV20DRAFT_53612 [Pilatotrama ljubarskyi]